MVFGWISMEVVWLLGAILVLPALPKLTCTCFQDYSIDEEAAFQAALALSLSEN